MPKSMRKRLLLTLLLGCGASSWAQTSSSLPDLIVDAVYYMDKYITPMTDAAVYQASSNWTNTTKAAKRWQFTGGIYTNIFVVPNRDRSFQLSNSEMKNLQLQSGNSAVLPSALGSDDQVTLTGNIDLGPQGIQPFSLYTPQGVNQETIVYPYLQMGVGVGKGFEVAGKFSGHVQLVHGYYQVYGASVKYNLGQWWPKLTQRKWNAAVLLAYNNEKVAYETFKANDPTAQSLLGGIDVLLAKVNTFQLQYHMSKTYGKFEFLSGILANYSTFRYQVDGSDVSSLSYQGNSLNTLLNRQLETIAKNKWNLIGELSCRYALWKHTFAQTTFAFGKFANWNGSIQFEF